MQREENNMNHNNIAVEPLKGSIQSFEGYKSPTIEVKVICILSMYYTLQKQLESILHIIKKQPISTNHTYLKTAQMAQDLSMSKSFLEKNMDSIFKEGQHFHRGGEARLLRWNVKEMHKWMEEGALDEFHKNLLSELLD